MKENIPTDVPYDEYDYTAHKEVANTIRQQLGFGGLATLGASDLSVLNVGMGALSFTARILPFNKNGKRSARAEKMLVVIMLDFDDSYTVRVIRPNGEVFFGGSHIYCTELTAMALALDYNGETVLNPRYEFAHMPLLSTESATV